MAKKALIVTEASGFVPQFEMNNIKLLQEKGYEIHYAANFDRVVYGTDNARLMGTGIERHHIPFEGDTPSFGAYKAYKALKNLLSKETFDLIHCHSFLPGLLVRKAAKEATIIYTAHGFPFYKGASVKNWFYYLLEKHYAKKTDYLVCINKEDYERAGKFKVRKEVKYVPGVGLSPYEKGQEDFDIKDYFGIPKENKLVVSVGELTSVKNHKIVLKAMDRFRKEPVTYLICGLGPMKEELQKAVKELHLEKKVILAGYCNNIRDILRQCDMFAFPSLKEGLSVAMMEAMEAGLPIMAADIRGNKDLIEDGKGGFLFLENLTEDYVRAIRYFMKYEEEAKRMGEWNKERVPDFYREKVEPCMREIYEACEGRPDTGLQR